MLQIGQNESQTQNLTKLEEMQSKKIIKTKLIHIQKSQPPKMSTLLMKFKVKVFHMRF